MGSDVLESRTQEKEKGGKKEKTARKRKKKKRQFDVALGRQVIRRRGWETKKKGKGGRG